MSSKRKPPPERGMDRQLWVWFSHEGRIGRSEYWLKGILMSIALFLTLGLLVGYLIGSEMVNSSLIWGYYGLCLWVSTAVYAKRWHDIGKSSWMLLLLVIPLVNLITFIYLGVEESEKGDNKYGPQP